MQCTTIFGRAPRRIGTKKKKEGKEVLIMHSGSFFGGGKKRKVDFFGFYPFGLHLRRHKYGRRVGGGTFAGERQAHIHRTAGYGMGGRKTKREKFISAPPPLLSLLQTQKSCFWREVVGCNIRASNRQDSASVQLSLSLSLYLPSVRKRAKGGGSDKRGDEFCFRPARIRIIFGVSLS